jgi:hypothetical protein
MNDLIMGVTTTLVDNVKASSPEKARMMWPGTSPQLSISCMGPAKAICLLSVNIYLELMMIYLGGTFFLCGV